MSEWITDRLPTSLEAYREHVWVMYNGEVEWCFIQDVDEGCPWHPIVIEKPEPYVVPEPKYYVSKFWLAEQLGKQNRWCVYCDVGGVQADNLPTREAAERVAAIYNEVMP